MCGIFGIIVKENADLKSGFISEALRYVARVSMARGVDSSGIVFKDAGSKKFDLIKGDISIQTLLKSPAFAARLKASLSQFSESHPFQAMGHARLVTNGSQLHDENNQPVVKDGIIGIHNGIIVNADELWEGHHAIKREYKIDTEILLSLIRMNLNAGNDIVAASQNAMNLLIGTVSTALFFDDRQDVLLMSNNGSLYYILTDTYLIFASEAFFLKTLVEKMGISGVKIEQMHAFTALVLNARSFEKQVFHQKQPVLTPCVSETHEPYVLKKENFKSGLEKEMVIDPSVFINRAKEKHLYDLLENNQTAIGKLKRCSKCILPETFPFIVYDTNGVCNYCHNYRPKAPGLNSRKLEQLVAPFRKTNGKADCIVPFSGGRDSTYSLHVIKTELKMNPITYTYDWGMVTDLARRNIARVCGKLGVENIIVSADIRQKRKYIQMNIEAWLRKPVLGMIPLFMSGDKAFHYYLTKLQKQTGISLNIWGENYLEKTDFKVGFAGVPPEFEKTRIYSLSKGNQFKMLRFLLNSVAENPAYINVSLLDNIKGQYARLFLKKTDYYNFYNFYPWDETTVNNTILSEYDWEGAIDTDSTWRIGDGTSAFYNYIYHTVAGFSEFDTFRSNQIREGMMTRDEAIKLVEKENRARYETLRWYLEIVGVDFTHAITRINAIPKLYK